MYKALLCLVLFAICSGPALKDASAQSITLKPITLRTFGTVPSSALPEIVPALKEKPFPLSEAINFAEVAARLPEYLTEGQKEYLEKHRFLLVPKTGAGRGQFYDEMLFNFDELGGFPQEWARRPEEAVLINPDVFLQALHKYFGQKLKYLERRELRAALQTVLKNLYANAKIFKAEGGAASTHWQRFMAQMLVPLILLENAAAPENYENPDNSDTLANALALLAPYSEDLGAELLAAAQTELERVYSASAALPSALGMFSTHHPEGLIDYTQFKPRGHYETASLNRAWFRAMIWLGAAGWNLKTENGLMDALNFALAMSYDTGQNPADEWQRVMEITSFFVGYPDAPGYPEWQSFVAERIPAPLSAQSSLDTDLMLRLASDLDKLPAPQTPFSSFQSKGKHSVITVFPQRFTVPWLIADRLTYTETGQANVFSALWVPALLGSRFAASLLPRQLLVSLAAQPNAAPDASPIPQTEAPMPKASDIMMNAYLIRLKSNMEQLAAALKQEPAESWFSSFATVWFYLLGALTSEYGEGFPLYMRDPAFASKQLETFMGAFTTLKHDSILYERPNYAEGGDGGGPEIPPVPKGFVEPNLYFWHGLLRTVSVLEEGFQHYGLYPNESEEFGELATFKSDVKFCADMAAKELRGQSLTEDEYERIRNLRLSYMAKPLDGFPVFEAKEALSGLVVDAQTVADELIVYEALAAPYIMLALVGNENSPRVVTGLAFNHREFITPYGERLSDSVWKERVYGPEENWDFNLKNALPLPSKNFWYDSLRPARTAGKPARVK